MQSLVVKPADYTIFQTQYQTEECDMAARKQKSDETPIDMQGVESRSGFDFTDETHRHRVATSAYYKAEGRGFSAGSEWDDWLSAEREIKEEAARKDQGGMIPA
jgi:hypothetical protein